MFLLILPRDPDGDVLLMNFKFHYVSINSQSEEITFRNLKSLNSIMFLLILLPLIHNQVHKTYFKFHYVSINSTSPHNH